MLLDHPHQTQPTKSCNSSATLFVLHHSLEELRIERNVLADLPNNLQKLPNLQSILASQNRIQRLPDFLLAPFSTTHAAHQMKTLGMVDAYSQKVNNMINNQQKDHQTNKPPLNRINLRSNQLKGHIILGNYGVS